MMKSFIVCSLSVALSWTASTSVQAQSWTPPHRSIMVGASTALAFNYWASGTDQSNNIALGNTSGLNAELQLCDAVSLLANGSYSDRRGTISGREKIPYDYFGALVFLPFPLDYTAKLEFETIDVFCGLKFYTAAAPADYRVGIFGGASYNCVTSAIWTPTVKFESGRTASAQRTSINQARDYRFGARVGASMDFMLEPRWILSPNVSVDYAFTSVLYSNTTRLHLLNVGAELKYMY